MIEPTIKKRSELDRLADIFSEIFGLYRIAAWLRGCTFSISATVKSPSLLKLGKGVVIQSGTILHCGGKAWCDYSGSVQIGDYVNIGPYCVIYGAGGVAIEEYVHLGPSVKLISQGGLHDANRLRKVPSFRLAPITIGAGSWIGAGAVIVAGVSVGRCVTVAPNSMITDSVPDYCMVAGNPGRILIKNPPIN